jgi:hypothetical protein
MNFNGLSEYAHLRFVANPGRIGVLACTAKLGVYGWSGSRRTSVQARTPIRPADLPSQQVNESQMRPESSRLTNQVLIYPSEYEIVLTQKSSTFYHEQLDSTSEFYF